MDKIIKEAIGIGKSIISKEINPNTGCAQLSELSQENNSPSELQIFELLAHEQYGHEHIGITAENTIPQIIEECENLVNKNS
jgi:hypothetical protein